MQPGVTVNERYEILSEIGRGGMGVVFRARSIALERDVAIKIFASQFNQESSGRAQREAKALAGVKHPNLVAVHSLETNPDGKLMLVFDYIEGKPLSAVLADGPLDLHAASTLFEQLCNGLQALHDSGFVHRDIKPSNLMVEDTADGGKHLTIIDFGLAKSTEQTAQKLTSTGAIVGTPQYMSPEQFAAQPATPQSDLYAAGCVLFEMLCGRAPYDDESPYMVANSHVAGTIPELPASVQNGAALNGFFQTALAKEPAKRFRTASEMWQGFCAGRDGGGLQAAIKTKKQKRQIKRYTFAAVIACSAFVITLLGMHQFFQKEHSTEKIGATDAVASTELHKIWIDTWSDDRHYREARARTKGLVAKLEKMSNGGLETANVYRFYMLTLTHEEEEPKDAEAALDAMRKAVAIVDKYGDKSQRANFELELGRTYFHVFDWKNSVKCMRTACELYQRKPSNMGVDAGMAIARALQMDGYFDEVTEQFKYVESPDYGHGRRQDQNAIRRDLAAAYDWLGQPERALKDVDMNVVTDDDTLGLLWDAKTRAMSFAFARQPKQSRASLARVGQLTTSSTAHGYPFFEDGCEALNYAALGDTAGATKLIEKIIGKQLHRPETESSREDAHSQIWAARMAMLAAEWVHRPDLIERSKAAMEDARMLLVRADLIDDGTFKLP